MSWLITPQQRIPAVIGEPFGGGFFAGYISHTADGNPTHALIVAPRATGATGTGYTLTTNLAWKTTTTTTPGATSQFDGVVNTDAIIASTEGIAAHPAANFCVNLRSNPVGGLGGFADWYLPSAFELNIAYFNLKPSTAVNIVSAGSNVYSVPLRNNNYTDAYPSQTALTAFNTTAEAFAANLHWSSTDSTANTTNYLDFNNGTAAAMNKAGNLNRLRAFRRIAL
tara:strand:+ start:111 stop:785 length:675 start_codon:yes stop_codon:yes gene_type:complete